MSAHAIHCSESFPLLDQKAMVECKTIEAKVCNISQAWSYDENPSEIELLESIKQFMVDA